MKRLSSIDQVVLALLLFIALMITMRIAYANNIRYAFLMWNLFLGWIPFQLSITLLQHGTKSRIYRYLLLAMWLLFFPNSLYIITDLIHLDESRGDAPVWYDAILLFTSSLTGLVMAFISLYQVEIFLRSVVTKRHVNKLIMAAIFLGSFGVYVGRFLRWNSWDIFVNPSSVFTEVLLPFVKPLDHFRTWGITMLLTALFGLLYFAVKKLPGLNEPGNNNQLSDYN